MFPVWVGAATGASLGCVASIFLMCQPEEKPIIVENISAEIYGNDKEPTQRTDASGPENESSPAQTKSTPSESADGWTG